MKQDGDERRSFTMPVASLEVPSPEESENVWSLIPQLKRKLHMQQKKAFEFLWRNLAGSVVPSMMDPSSDKIGGCVVSHTPGAGKHFSSYPFSQATWRYSVGRGLWFLLLKQHCTHGTRSSSNGRFQFPFTWSMTVEQREQDSVQGDSKTEPRR